MTETRQAYSTDPTKHLWRVVVSYRYASEEKKAEVFVMATNIKDACNIALSDYDVLSQDWPADHEPFVLSAKLVSYYVYENEVE